MATAPVILSNEPGSFAWGVFHDRHPKLIQQLLDALPYPAEQRRRLRRLLDDSLQGVLAPLNEDAHDHGQWLDWGQGLWGLPWGDAPFLWAESYFYRCLLDATGYFEPGPWQGVDPFAPFKAAELSGSAVDDELAALGELVTLPENERRDALLLSSLWGNRADLSFQITSGGAAAARSSALLADDTALLWSRLASTTSGTVALIADNAGRELLPDLLLIDHLLVHGLAAQAVLYVKPHPYYISDATMADTLAAIERLAASSEPEAVSIGHRLSSALRRGTLLVRTHQFFCAPLPFHDLPTELADELAAVDLAILKGDLNYRRLVGDRSWPAVTPFAEATAYFPTAVAALRTLKSEVVVGLEGAVVSALDDSGEPWRTSGRHAVAQVRA